VTPEVATQAVLMAVPTGAAFGIVLRLIRSWGQD
jgi:hypothetical protein